MKGDPLIEAGRLEAARVEAVRLLWAEKGDYVSRPVLYALLARVGCPLTDDEFNAVLIFLKDRGYVKYKIERRGGRDWYSFRLTDKGQELVSGDLRDRGVPIFPEAR